MQLGYQRCQRLIGSGMLPGRDGQPLQLNVHVDLAELRAHPGAAGLEQGWSTARAAAGLPGSVHLTGPEAGAAACDAALTPIVSGHIDWNVLDHLTSLYLDTAGHRKSPYSGADGALPELTSIPWSKGGPTTLGNLAMFCRYHHIIVIHRWGWKITCHPNGTTTATSPHGRILHSHGPPTAVA
jgi:hypothetical protein